MNIIMTFKCKTFGFQCR